MIKVGYKEGDISIEKIEARVIWFNEGWFGEDWFDEAKYCYIIEWIILIRLWTYCSEKSRTNESAIDRLPNWLIEELIS